MAKVAETATRARVNGPISGKQSGARTLASSRTTAQLGQPVADVQSALPPSPPPLYFRRPSAALRRRRWDAAAAAAVAGRRHR